MTLKSVLKALRERRQLFVACFLITFVATLVVSFLLPKQYSATISFYVSTQTAVDNPNLAYQGSLLSQDRIKTYSSLVTSDRVLRATINDLKLDETPAQLASHITVTAPQDSVLLSAAVKTDSDSEGVAIANALGKNFLSLVTELEQPPGQTREASIVTKIVEPAVGSIDPISPNIKLNAVLGFLGGLIVAGIAVYLSETLDTRVKSSADLLSATNKAPLLATVQVSTTNPESRSAEGRLEEDFRKLRTNLRYVSVDRELHAIAISSATAGEGKSTTARGLAEAVSRAGTKAILIDGDLRRPSLASVYGVDGSLGLTELLTGRVSPPAQAVHRIDSNLDLLCSGSIPPNPAELLSSSSMAKLISDLSSRYELVVVDTAPVLPVSDTLGLLPLVDGVVLVTRYASTKRETATSAYEAIELAGGTLLGTILNAAPTIDKTYGYYEAQSRAGTFSPRDTAPRPTPRPRP